MIPSKDGAHLLPSCLEALRAQSIAGLELIVVDDGSRDQTAALLAQRYPEVRRIGFARSRGFAAAANAGIRAATRPNVALVNNDAVVAKDWARELLAALESDTSAGSAASRLLRADDGARLDGVGDGYTRGGLAYKRGWGRPNGPEFDRPAAVFGACAAAALYRRAALDQAGLLDESYGSYVEDVDLAFRLQLLGYRCLYVPAAQASHAEASSSGGRMTAPRARLIVRNSLRTVVKDYPGALLLRNLHRVVLDQARLLFHLGGRGRKPVAALRGVIEAFGFAPRDLKQRRRIQARRRIALDALARLLRQGDDELAAQRRRAVAG
ncbi:MAG TPA: glycosyltransferase [Acidobacteriota bacterium]